MVQPLQESPLLQCCLLEEQLQNPQKILLIIELRIKGMNYIFNYI